MHHVTIGEASGDILGIFEPFYTTKFTGRGLGMSAILGIIKGHNGALQLFTKLGEGTTFKVFLPALTGVLAHDTSSNQVSQTSWKGSGTILLAEDDLQIRLVAKLMLENSGFKVIEATNGSEALDMYHEHSEEITMAVTDISMPVMDGYQLFRELKMLDPKLPIIVASGFGNTVVTEQIPQEEIAGFIQAI